MEGDEYMEKGPISKGNRRKDQPPYCGRRLSPLPNYKYKIYQY